MQALMAAAAALAVAGALAGCYLGAAVPTAGGATGERVVGAGCRVCLSVATAASVSLVFLGAWRDGWVTALVVAGGVIPLIALAGVDAATKRLPDRWTRPLTLYAAAGVTVAAIVDGGARTALLAALSGTLLAAFYLALALLGRGRGMGLGDAKLALPIGLLTGLVSPSLTVAATVLAFVGGAAYGAWLMVVRRADRRVSIPFGPFMVLGMLLPLLIRGVLALIP